MSYPEYLEMSSNIEPEASGENWELSKENIQPLKQGRRVSVLSAALDQATQNKLNQQKQ